MDRLKAVRLFGRTGRITRSESWNGLEAGPGVCYRSKDVGKRLPVDFSHSKLGLFLCYATKEDCNLLIAKDPVVT